MRKTRYLLFFINVLTLLTSLMVLIEFIEFIGHTEAQIISDHSLPVYIRQLALHANVS